MKGIIRITALALVGALALTAVFGIGRTVRAEDPKDAKAALTYENEKWGIKVTKPEDPTWMFPSDSELEHMFKNPPDNLAFSLVKMKTPGSKIGAEFPQVIINTMGWPADARGKIGDREVEAANVKGWGRAIFESFKEDYKDIKNEKELEQATNYTFCNKILNFSFNGVHKKSGMAEWVQCWFFKANQKTYMMVIEVPAGNDKVFAKDIDKIMRSIVMLEKKK
ncbi:MAG: hypothetical protein HZA54_18590 [Planctomycetes bacterium]|nr:hypothetical protein [Planctomycetota bacterium]